MITNERQYKITRAEAEKFKQKLSEISSARPADVHPRLIRAEKEALKSQLDDLLGEISEYEKLKAGDVSVIKIDTLDDLANGLIKARIATGLSQKALAERLHLKEQQIQRYESERYESASLQRLKEIADAIGIQVRKEILLPLKPSNFDGVVRKLQQVGLEYGFLLSKLLPSPDAIKAENRTSDEVSVYIAKKTATILERIFGWTHDEIFSAHPLSTPRFAAAEARFKMPAKRKTQTSNIYAVYANYLAVTVLNASREMSRHRIPIDAEAVREAIIKQYGVVNFASALNYVWDLGIPVLPLNDSGTFHGACWRYGGRNIIVLKQNSKYEARWLYDLLHELFHAGQNPDSDTFELIEADETSSERRNSEEEIAAGQFAGDISLDNRAEELAEICVIEASGSVERLKKVIPKVAKGEGVSVGALANYMAFRLSWQNINWWGAAANLQKEDTNPWKTARDIFCERFQFAGIADLDLELLKRALQ